MLEIKQKITSFFNNLQENYGFLPKSCYTQGKFNGYIYYSGPFYDENESIALIETFLFGKWMVYGEKCHKFEVDFCNKTRSKYAVMVNSGSSANLLMISVVKKVLGWNDEDEIIVSVVGFPTTAAAIIHNNLKCVFVDIEFETLNFNLEEVEKKITSKTKAIFISPVLGNPPNFDKLLELKEKYKIELILDGCDSLGSKWMGKNLNEYCLVSSCSFFPAHHISTLQGGMVYSDNQEIINKTRNLSAWSRSCYCVGAANLLKSGTCNRRFDKWIPELDTVIDHKYVYTDVGYNLQPLDVQGALGIEQLKKLNLIHQKRRQHKQYIESLFLKYIKNIKSISENKNSEISWFGVPFICNDKLQKQNLVAYLEKNNIQTRNYFAGNLLIHPGYKQYGDWKQYPEANKVLDLVFFVGCAPMYTSEHLDYIELVLSKYASI